MNDLSPTNAPQASPGSALPPEELDRMERKIRSEEAHAMAALELGDESFDAQFRALEAESDVEDELEALKKALGSGGSASLTAGN